MISSAACREPDLVIAGRYSTAATRLMIRQGGIARYGAVITSQRFGGTAQPHQHAGPQHMG